MNQLTKTAVAGVAFFLFIQLVPFGRNHKNPPVTGEPSWSTTELRALAKKACFDCHSNETVWPAYSNIAPMSWLIYYDVAAARKKLNFSDWQKGGRAGEDPAAVAYQLTSNNMPPFRYIIAHPDAKLSSQERKKLAEGLLATFSQPIK
ncbi:MAG: heme-binding domain-containing protein [Geobacteraceae bacterium]|nr:heme-binding domain-containing protein [Geobacteraceae bacterium]